MEICFMTQGTQTGLCNNLEGWERVGGGREFTREGTYVHLWLIHVEAWQKSNQYCKEIINQITHIFGI